MMRRSATARAAVIIAAASALTSVAMVGWTAVPVEESSQPARPSQTYGKESSGGYSQQDAGSSGAASTSGGGQDLAQLFYQLQLLQQEVQDLSGKLEEQGHRLDRLAKDQQEQYLDLDRRMQALRNGSAGAAAGGSGGSGAGSASSEPDQGSGETAGAAPSGAGEREAYAAAFQLMKQRQFDQAIDAFNQLVANYPNGAYTPNAFYWLGELYLAEHQLEKARQYFAQVVNLYPDHQKVPDALYKLGVVYDQLGDKDRSREYLNKVVKQYPQSSAAGLAQTYLSDL